MRLCNQPIGLYALLVVGMGLFLGSSQARSLGQSPNAVPSRAIYQADTVVHATHLYSEPAAEVEPVARHHDDGQGTCSDHDHDHDHEGHDHHHHDDVLSEPVDADKDAKF